ncbi:MAG: alpha/beta hydrolase [Brumimicrobium sp.]
MGEIFLYLGILIAVIFGVFIILILIIRLYSRGKLKPLRDEKGNEIKGSIAEKKFIEVGGIKQGLFIRSENYNNPVILFLHGGPGGPELPTLLPFETTERLEKYFTVCYWEQRNSGMSYNKHIDLKTLTIAQFIEDIFQVTEYLKQRFNQEKIYLLGHSWGSYLGIKTIQKHPQYYIAFVGVGQLTNQKQSEILAYDYMLKLATEKNQNSDIKKLKKYDRDNLEFVNDFTYIAQVRGSLLNKYGIGSTRDKPSSTMAMLKLVLKFEGYTLMEKVNYLKGMISSTKSLWSKVVEDNLFESSTQFQVPVYIAHGKYDYQVSYSLSREWFEKIEAPKKAFYTFENSAHGVMVEEPEKFIQIMKDIAKQTNLQLTF